MNDDVRMIMHQLMTDRQHRAKAQKAMMYGHTTGLMDSKQFASYLSIDGLKKASELELYTLLLLFYEATKEETYNPQKYFTASEIAKLSGHKAYKLHSFDVLAELNQGEYLSVMDWGSALKLLKKISEAQQSKQFPKHNLMIAVGAAQKNSAEFIKQKIKKDLYLPPLIGINIIPDEYDITAENGVVSIPLDVPACRIVAPADILAMIEQIDNIDDYVKSFTTKRLAPVRITNYTALELRLKHFSEQ